MARLERLEERVLAMQAQLKALEADHDGTAAGLARLRGRFYATKPAAEGEPAGESRDARKRAAFAKLGIVPGKPVDLRKQEAQ